MNKIAVIGTGYVGLVSGTCLADFGMEITCIDNDTEKINALNNGIVPLYEPGLDIMIEKNCYYKRLNFSTDTKKAVEENEVIFIAVGTPPKEDGSADLQYVLKAAEEIASYMNGYKVIVNKSTVPVGTGLKIKEAIGDILKRRKVNFSFDIVSNPEFLREGAAVRDFIHPERVVLGADSQKAIDIMKEVYRVLYINETPFLITNLQTAELIKYASNAFLASKIAFINELTELCEKVGADIQQVSKGMGMDTRIGSKFLHAGPGYGGSCFPKDTKALTKTAKDNRCTLNIVEAAIIANENQKRRMAEKIISAMENVEGKTLSVLGLSFKPETDDMREAPSITIINSLFEKGARFRVYDPQGLKEAKCIFENIKASITYCINEYEACRDADAVIIITEWNQFRNLNLSKIKNLMKGNHFFDLRNIYDPEKLKQNGFIYISVGR
ncbi:UDP-glucose dehydrogenase family protein [Clostridium polynesiense]|uniref:UDP-glucose dehydrogenase family protein n=1 Tax=Clostridium polynesiense TaxID=1325933 RepID=UPI00058BE95D|nr:UDP-glucose/GDP-mannose dehydrogenase family protein [Clostridium polynesiense]